MGRDDQSTRMIPQSLDLHITLGHARARAADSQDGTDLGECPTTMGWRVQSGALTEAGGAGDRETHQYKEKQGEAVAGRPCLDWMFAVGRGEWGMGSGERERNSHL